MFSINVINQLLWANPLVFGAKHNSSAMSVIGTYIDAVMPTQALKANPNISLNGLH
jgi:hypothetical protein